MSFQQRNNVHCHGNGHYTMVLVHDYGCDQTMWRFLYPAFAERHQVVLLDLVGSGGSDLSAYDRDKYSTLHGYADDLLEVIDEFAIGRVILVGHSVSAMIGMLATIKAPDQKSSPRRSWSVRRRASSTTTTTWAASTRKTSTAC